MNNLDIRREIKEAGLKIWQVADKFGYTDSTFSRKLRKELPEEDKMKIREAIVELKAGGENYGSTYEVPGASA